MNVFWREIKAYRRSLLFWIIGMALLIGASMGKYAGMAEQVASLREMIALYPKPLLALFGIGTFDIGTPEGYFGVVYSFIMIVAGLHAAMLGADLLSKEERDRTAEFLLVKPIPRMAVLARKAAAGLACAVALGAVAWVVSYAVVSPHMPDAGAFLAPLMLGLLAFQALFLCVGLMIGAVARTPRRAGGIASMIVVAMFLLDKMADFMNANALKYVTPFGFFGADRVIDGGGYGALVCVLAAVVILAASAVAAWAYPRRDVRV